ncbi:DUF1611 domain-containing protein [Flammeovirgaceae bacterium SG7u.111]|nr:DUF1611 domain-containing protein [Flammeovirgaceae bacterium SG7u.132]WPO35321.1 DUF1611 domain-containing protein [Flammeovirgaceae bacterium SG7u.111]
MDGNAIVLTNGQLDHYSAKTAHGLIRGTERYKIVGVIDPEFVGKDAGEVLDGKCRDIPVFSSVKDFLKNGEEEAQYCIMGIASKGGVMPEELIPELKDALNGGVSLVSGLHECLSDNPEIAEMAAKKGLEIIDIRKPKSFKELHFWKGKISKVTCPKIAVLGTDCNMGKRTTARFIKEALVENGFKAEMIYTGQTGWMQGNKYGFIFDSTLNDFISGEIEHAIVSCFDAENPDAILLEGQSALRNPSGPCGAEFIISGETNAVVLQHDPDRTYFHGCEGYKNTIPSLAEEIELIKTYGAPTIAVTLNTKTMSNEDAESFRAKAEEELGIPVILPLKGVDRLGQVVSDFVKNFK